VVESGDKSMFRLQKFALIFETKITEGEVATHGQTYLRSGYEYNGEVYFHQLNIIAPLGNFGCNFFIWICQNKVQRPRYWGNIVEVFLDRFCTLGIARFYVYVVLLDGAL
jgi:hypothetical protein